MKLSQFNFKLPKDQVALYPHKAKHVVKTASGERTFEITRRDESRLMVLHKKSETIEMYKKDENGKDMVDADGNPVFLQFKDIVNFFEEGDTFIFNNTKVFPARLLRYQGEDRCQDRGVPAPRAQSRDASLGRIGRACPQDPVSATSFSSMMSTRWLPRLSTIPPAVAVPSVSSMMRMAVMMSSSVRSSLWARLHSHATSSDAVRIITLQRMIWTISSVFSLR